MVNIWRGYYFIILKFSFSLGPGLSYKEGSLSCDWNPPVENFLFKESVSTWGIVWRGWKVYDSQPGMPHLGPPLAKARLPKETRETPRNSQNHLCLRSLSSSLLSTERGPNSTRGYAELFTIWLPFQLISNYSPPSTHTSSTQSSGIPTEDRFPPLYIFLPSFRSALPNFKAELKLHARQS